MTRTPASRLIGRGVVLVVSDPWELVDEHGNNWFEGAIAATHPCSADVDHETILIDLTQPVTWRSVNYGSVLLRARHRRGLVDALSESEPVDCKLIGISGVERERPDGLDMNDWRGGLSASVSVVLGR